MLLTKAKNNIRSYSSSMRFAAFGSNLSLTTRNHHRSIGSKCCYGSSCVVDVTGRTTTSNNNNNKKAAAISAPSTSFTSETHYHPTTKTTKENYYYYHQKRRNVHDGRFIMATNKSDINNDDDDISQIISHRIMTKTTVPPPPSSRLPDPSLRLNDVLSSLKSNNYFSSASTLSVPSPSLMTMIKKMIFLRSYSTTRYVQQAAGDGEDQGRNTKKNGEEKASSPLSLSEEGDVDGEINDDKSDDDTIATTTEMTASSSSSPSTATATTTTMATNSSSSSEIENDDNGDIYNPWDIINSFKDTSYYYPPEDEMESEYLAAKYADLSNEELMDSTTIRVADDELLVDNNESSEGTTNTTILWNELIHSPPIRDAYSKFPNGTLVGTVVSTKMQKTINVAVDRYRVHKKYHKRLKYTRKFMAHDESEVACMGDTVVIVPCQRVSKKKHFLLRKIIKAKGQL